MVTTLDRVRLEEIMRRTGNSIKRMEWESNKRQIGMKDKIMMLLGKKKASYKLTKVQFKCTL